MSGFGPTGLREVAREEAAGLRRALILLREEARSFPGPEGSSAFAAAIRSVERELSRVERCGGGA
jgi:hypothetical protein